MRPGTSLLIAESVDKVEKTETSAEVVDSPLRVEPRVSFLAPRLADAIADGVITVRRDWESLLPNWSFGDADIFSENLCIRASESYEYVDVLAEDARSCEEFRGTLILAEDLKIVKLVSVPM
ncbi:unnamed protein product [Dibothriocephalus latus]|uniref:Uncharacterized protein n=1 Tax=Dibothriocephalus latus TaxID=60516 RepID=A0A3P7LHV4_DIBLA|nr:unnamed protein product [Dibothriocephalus latus]